MFPRGSISLRMLDQISREFELRKASVPTHFLCRNEDHDIIEGRFNQPRLCTLIQDGWLNASMEGGLVHSVQPTDKCFEMLRGCSAAIS